MKIFCDWNVNRSNIKGRLILVGYRISHMAASNKILFFILLPHLIFYRITVEWILGCELPYKTVVGENLTIYHGQALVINDGSIIGNNCTLRHSTTIGNIQLPNGDFSLSPVIGDNVNIGSNVCILGPITIGNNVKIGAGAVVIKSVPDNAVVVGNPGRIVRYLTDNINP